MNRTVSAMCRIVSAVLLATSLGACTTLGFGGTAIQASIDQAQVPAEAASVIAEDLVGRLAEAVGPGTGTIALKPDGTAFGTALEASLRKWGYAVSVDQKAEGEAAIPLVYVIDTVEGSVLARLSTTTVDIGRAYTLTATGAEPASPLSVMRRG